MMVSHANDMYVNIGFGTSIVIIATITLCLIWYMFRDTRGIRHSLATASTRVSYVVSADTMRIAKMRKSGRHAIAKVDPHKAVDPFADFGTSEYNWNYDWDENHYHYDKTTTYEQQLNLDAYENELEDDDEFESWDGASGWERTTPIAPSTDVAVAPNNAYTRQQVMVADEPWWRTAAGSEWIKPVTVEDVINLRAPRQDGLPHIVDAPVSPAMTNAIKQYGRHSVLTAPGTYAQRALMTSTMEMQAISDSAWDLVEPSRELVGASALG